MTLTLYYHPLSSYCWKALIALYENDTPFERHILDNLGDEKAAAEFKAMWPLGKFPVLRDAARDRIVPETSIIIDYLDRHYGGAAKLIPDDPDDARDVRFRDRFFDNYVMTPMQAIVGDRLRPDDAKDPFGVTQAQAQLETALKMIDEDETLRGAAQGEGFTMADCAAAPALFYADKVAPFESRHKGAADYLARLKQRPSFARVLKEAEPYFHLFPEA